MGRSHITAMLLLGLTGCQANTAKPERVSCPSSAVVNSSVTADAGATMFTLTPAGRISCAAGENDTLAVFVPVSASMERETPASALVLANPEVFITGVDEANQVLGENYQRLSLKLEPGRSRVEEQFPLRASLPAERLARLYIGYTGSVTQPQ